MALFFLKKIFLFSESSLSIEVKYSSNIMKDLINSLAYLMGEVCVKCVKRIINV